MSAEERQTFYPAEIPAELLKDKTPSEQDELTRYYFACARLEDSELSQIQTLAQERYDLEGNSQLPTRAGPINPGFPQPQLSGALRIGRPRKLAPTAILTSRLGNIARKHITVPLSLQKLLRMKNRDQKRASAPASPVEQVGSTLATLTESTFSSLESCISERIGVWYNPLSNIRTAYQDEQLCKLHMTAVRTYSPATTTRPAAVFGGATPRVATKQRNYLPLDLFDYPFEDLHTPEEWVALGGSVGTPARSRYYTGPSKGAVWRPCRVMGFDSDRQKFLLQWPDGKTKWARRLNILFDAEDPKVWQQRVEEACRRRRQHETTKYQGLYLQSIPDTIVTTMNPDQMDRIILAVASNFPLPLVHILHECVAEVEATYCTALKKARVLYDLHNAAEQERLKAYELPPLASEPEPSLRDLKGTLHDMPEYNFMAARAALATHLFHADPLLHPVLSAIHTLAPDYMNRMLCIASRDDLDKTQPLQLERFMELQARQGTLVSEKLRSEWVSTVLTTIQNSLEAHFNFYEDKLEKYQCSRIQRFICVVNHMMQTQLRQLLLQSLTDYTAFMATYRVMGMEQGTDTAMPDLPEDVVERDYWRQRHAILAAKRRQERQQQQQRLAPGASRSSKPKLPTSTAAAAVAVASEASKGQPVCDDDEPPYVSFAWRLGSHNNTIPYTTRVVAHTARVNGLCPLFTVKLVECNGAVAFQPLLEEVTAGVLQVFENCFDYSSRISVVGDQLFPLLPLYPQYLEPLLEGKDGEPTVCEARAELTQVLHDNLEAPRQLQQMYKEFEYLLKSRPEAVVEDAVTEDLSLDEFELVFERLTRDVRRIAERTPHQVKYEFFSVNCQELKTLLTRKANLLMSSLMDLLSTRLREGCSRVLERYEQIFSRISIDPTTPEELQELRGYLDGVAQREEAIQEDFHWITEGNELLLRYRYLVPEKDFATYWVASAWPQKLRQRVDERVFRCKECRMLFIQNLHDNSERLMHDIIQLAVAVEDFAHHGDDTRADEFYEHAKGISKLIATYQAQVTLYNRHEELFGLAVTQYPQLKETKTQFEPYFVLWELSSVFHAETERWLNTRLSSLQPVEVEQKVTDWGKRILMVSKQIKEVEPSKAVKRLLQCIERFRPNIPLLYALRSHLQAAHWRSIYHLCGIPKDKQGFGPGGIDMNDAWPLAEFLKLGLLRYLPQIEGVASIAQKTFVLETDLMTMESEWKKLLFEMEPYQDTYKLKANDTMQLTLDEHILKTQSMLGKPIVHQAPALQARVSQWARQLDYIQCTMDQWFRCQNTWFYLEPIFASADIARSLPHEKQCFVEVDRTWNSIMEHTRTTPQVLTRCQDETLLRALDDANRTLELVLHRLQQFLETKRVAFPRFYFISNEELLQILSDSKDPYLVQPYLCKCFEGIKRIQFGVGHEIVGMESAEGEHVALVTKVCPGDHENQVERWLQAVECSMKDTVRDQLRQAIGDYAMQSRVDFIRSWPGQVVIAVCSIFWTAEATRAMREEGAVGLSAFFEKCTSQLEELIVLVRDSNLGVVERCTLEALVVIEVHAKDTIGMLCEKGVDDPTSFNWIAQLRYYWRDGHLVVEQINASLQYGYEYLGNTGRLVITPLTDRCYRTLLGALHLNYGGAPEGPAGTGKTETTKDLAKALGKYCVVYNCSDQISAKDMAKLFKGLTQAGAWGCFDEFNRIEIQVLSVIAQQVATIQEAIIQRRCEFIFDGVQVRLDPGCAIFVTMNPGYAGRAELPDNLKALFRPVAMMVPNYAMIGEIQLYSYGFLHGKVLSEKIVATYRLCSEQLSSQDHYDYGMRAVKAVLTAAGRLKRALPQMDEMALMLRSIQDVNLPKFLSQDVELFKGIVSDLFPGVQLPAPDYVDLHHALVVCCQRKNIQLTAYFEEKIRQTYEMICVRHGMMVVGYSYGGKTQILQCLAEGLTEMEATRKELRTRIIALNPKSITLAQLYGKMEQSGEWTDGVLSSRFRYLAQDTGPDRKWLVLDGPVDAVWIENMNTVLDDNKKLCLQNGDIIPMARTMNLVFEVQDLAHASPATVSRCGMVYVEPRSLGWRCLMRSFMNTLPSFVREGEELVKAICILTETLLEEILEFVRKNVITILPQGSSTAVASFIKLFVSFLDTFDENGAARQCNGDQAQHTRQMLMRIEGWFLFALVWSVGGCLSRADRQKFSDALHQITESRAASYKFTLTLPDKAVSYYDVRLDDGVGAEVKFVDWAHSVPELVIAEGSEYQDIIIPTSETAKYSFLMQRMIHTFRPGFLVGDTGTGKTILMKFLLKSLPREAYQLNLIQFSAQTTAGHLQRLIDNSCERRRKGYYGPPLTKKMLVFIDDTNLPQLEGYGAQPPIELLRQYLDHGAWYNHSKDGIELRHLVDLLLLCAMGPAGGGRNHLTPRFTRHFNVFSVPSFDTTTLRKIFGQLTDWILSRGFPASLRSQNGALVAATVELYQTLCEHLKPSPEKSHYTFNLRDVSKVFQGIDMAHATRITDELKLAELWLHEVSRAFADRFTDSEDSAWFAHEAERMCSKHFKVAAPAPTEGPLLFSTLMNDEGNYEKMCNLAEARRVLEQKVDAYNAQSRVGELNLVIFNYVLEHVTRISRVLKQPGGNLLLVGVGGSGRRSCTRLAAYLQECDYVTITAATEYGPAEFLEDIRQVLLRTGLKGYATAFVLSDSQITSESFLEEICSLLNSGEVPGLWEAKQDRESYENAVASLRELAKNMGRVDTVEALQALFLERCRKHLHIVLCFSPLGSVLRERLRKFPSLVNCTTIDWFREWPEDGLRSVATRFLSHVALTEPESAAIREMFVSYQQKVRGMCETYLAEARQHIYVTPTSYLDLLSTFERLLHAKRAELSAKRQRYANGLAQLKKAEDQVEVMQDELALLKPELAEKQKQTDQLICQVEQESKAAEAQRAMVAVDEAAANEQAAAAKKIKDASQAKVEEAQPLVEQARQAVLDLDPKALQEIKALKTPPLGVKYVIEVLCTLLGGPYKPKTIRDPLTGKNTIPYWEHAKTTLLTAEFNNILLNAYPDIVDNAPDSQIMEVKRKMSNDMFRMDKIRKTSVALVGVATYIKAVVEYYQQNKIIKPLLAQAAAAQAEYDGAMQGLNKKKEELRVITETLQALTNQLEQVNHAKQELERKVADTDTKLTRAKKLIEGLGGEKTRFSREAQNAERELTFVVGNVVVTAGIVAYMGPFLHQYRQEAVTSWVQLCKQNSILVSDDFTLERFCGNPIDIQDWRLQQLPSDSFSVSNAIIMKHSSRWPLLVDPQQQGNNWIRNCERENQLVVVRPSERDYIGVIRRAISQGRPVLLENLDETLDPMLENLLLKQVTREGCAWVMQLGEPVEWREDFRFYMTTKLPRPHYLPEVSTKVTLINFMITAKGLEDQLLQRVMLSERRDVEEKKQALTFETAVNQAGLQSTEDRILTILSAEGNILESEEAIEELDRSKEQSDRIAKRQEEIEAMERISDRTRNLFVPVAHLGAVLFFCVTEMANIDPMYQNSLQFYISIFQEALTTSERATDVTERIGFINHTFKSTLYQRISRSLFAKDQLIFSFIMSLRIYEVDPTLLRWLLMGGFEERQTRENLFPWLPQPNWEMLCRANSQLHLTEQDLPSIVEEHVSFFQDYYESSNPLEMDLPAPLDKLCKIERMVLTRCFRTDKMVSAVTDYVRETLGDAFVQPPLYALETVVDELAYDPSIPIILVLSQGTDPNVELDRVAELRGMLPNRLFKLSLGQGQENPARALIESGTQQGHWVLLQNCHLYKDFMPLLSRIIENHSDLGTKEKLHHSYRLWLTSLPSEAFPVAILQNGVKLVQEPPKGLKSNLLHSYLTDPIADNKFFYGHDKAEVWQKLLFGLCFFHAVVQERRQYGPLGWNRPYEFNDTDRRISIRQLHIFLGENDTVPYEALLYLIGECNYGGRVTDDWDRRCLAATLRVYITPLILNDKYCFCSDAEEYYAPPFGEYDTYINYAQSLPLQQPPTIFGLHENADITKDERDARFLLSAVLSTQPRAAASSLTKASLNPKATVKQIASDICYRLPELFDIEALQAAHPIDYAQSMNTVLLQETIRYNRLLGIVRGSLAEVQDAISGRVVMSAELEQVFNDIYDGKVPELWKRKSYPSLKPFGAYVKDLIARLEFLGRWCAQGPPVVFWLSGFFFTQSFFTGVMQNYARKYHIEIDRLVWDFKVMPEGEPPKEVLTDGCYINGLFLEGAGWENGILTESKPKELFISFPTLRLTPIRSENIAENPVYHCPCYKTTDRKGVLSTTGHSTNFILIIDLPCDPEEEENHWVLRGTALFTQLEY